MKGNLVDKKRFSQPAFGFFFRHSESKSSITVSRAELYQNAPKLPEDVLQQLLAEARQTLGTSTPSTTRTERDPEGIVFHFVVCS